MHRFTIVLALAACVALSAHAAEDPSTDQARSHAAKAKVHYDLGEYEKAAEEYILVYRIRPLPAVLFNIAQSYRRAARYEKAKQFYESYLRETQDASNRATVERAIREIDELLAKEKRAKDGPPTGVAQDSGALTPPPAKATSPLPPVPATPGAPSVASGAPAQKAPAPIAAAPSAPASATPPAGSPAAQPAVSRTPAVGAPSRAPAPIAATTPASPKPAKSRTLTWVAAGASAAALAAGGVFGAKTLSSRSQDDASKANLLYAVGGGLAVVTGALLLFDF